MKSGIELIAEERKRQVEVEGWTAAHDAKHDENEIAWAAVTYAIPDDNVSIGDDPSIIDAVTIKFKRLKLWPWENKWWRPTPRNRVKELVKAGALIAAEIDRLQAHSAKQN